jgi:penicillin V acylase-like amidase (Ntn superfamily)
MTTTHLILAALAALSVVAATPASACTVFVIDSGRQVLVGRNDDRASFDEGMAVVSPRGRSKTSFTNQGEPLEGLGPAGPL